MEKTKAEQLFSQSLQEREKGRFVESLKLSSEARIAFQEENNKVKFAETLAGDHLTYRHLFDATGDRVYLVLAKLSAQAGLELAEMSGDKTALAIPLFNLAKVLETLGQTDEAIAIYHKANDAIEANPPASHNRPGVKADFKIHMTTSEYMTGDETAYDRALAAIAELEATDETKYNKDVWLSGGHMRLAAALKTRDIAKAKMHLTKAKEIIDNNPELILRKQQWQKLADSL